MTADEKIWTKHESKRLAIERKWYKIINEVLLNNCNTAIEYVGDRDIIWHGGLNEKIRGGEMAFVITALNLSTVAVFASINDKQLLRLKSSSGEGFNKWLETSVAYFREHNLQFVKDITDASRERIVNVLMKAQEQGVGVKERAKMLLDEGFNKVRARRIARTETVRASNYGNMVAAIESDLLLKKRWVATNDARTRDSHRGLNGELIDLYDDFKPGLMFPGDPNAAANETINCRCTLAYVPQRDENGELMRKPSPVMLLPVQTVQPVDYSVLIEEMIQFINLTPGRALKEIVSDKVYRSVKYLFEWLGLITLFNKLFE